MPAPTTWLIGAAPECDLVVDVPSVSGRHCRLTLDGDGFLLEDLGSTNGTFVNGARVVVPSRVNRGDRVTLGVSVPMPWPSPMMTTATPKPIASPGSDSKKVIRVGRDPDNDFVIDNSEVSSLHARVIVGPGGDRGEVQDLGSTNGTAVNDPERRVTHSPFKRGDTLYFGPIPVPAARFLVDTWGTMAVPEPPLVPAPEPVPADGIPLIRFTGTTLTMGRDPGCDRVFDSPLVSSRHARLLRSGPLMVIEDLRSSNGTFVNGRRLVEPTPVKPGDLIGLGTLTFRLAEAGTEGASRFTPTIASSASSAPVPPGRPAVPAPSATAWTPARVAAVIGFAAQPLVAALAVLVLGAAVGNDPVAGENGPTRGTAFALFGLGFGAVWLGLAAAAAERVVRGRPAGLHVADFATTLALGGGILVVASGAMFGIVSALRGFEGEGFVTILFLGLTAFTGFALGRAVIGLTGKPAVAAAVGLALVMLMVLPAKPMPEISPAVRWLTGVLPTRWSFEGLLLINEPKDARAGERPLAEPFFPGDAEQAGTTACVTALALMAIGLAYADLVTLVAWPKPGSGRSPSF